MTTFHDPASTPRRSFLHRVAGLSALLAAGGARPALAAEPQQGSEPWLAAAKGKHKQVFDGPHYNEGFPMIYAMTYLGTMTDTYKLAPGEASAIIVLRHTAMPLGLTDAMWAKYKVGQSLGITDPATKQPATRNIFYNSRPGDFAFVDASIDKMLERKATFVVCGLALQVLSGMWGKAIGVDAATAKSEWTAGLIPGLHIAPSGVLAVARAQEHGCTYCYAG